MWTLANKLQNENQYTTTTDLTGTWAEAATFAPAGSRTCSSQTTFILRGRNDKWMYMGDRWYSDRLDESQYIWQVLSIDPEARTAEITCSDGWNTSEIGL